MPGESLAPGVHTIKYVAIDQDELSTQCVFNITVLSYYHSKRIVVAQPPANERTNGDLVHQHPNGLQPRRAPHDLGPSEAYVMCPNRVAMKLDTTFPVSSFRVFYKNLYEAAEARTHVTSKIYAPPNAAGGDDRQSGAESSTATSASSTKRVPSHFIDIYHWVV